MTSEAKSYYLVINEEAAGPFSEMDVLQQLRDGKISKDTFCCPVGEDEWGTVRQHISTAPNESQKLPVNIASKQTVKLKLPQR